MKKEAEENEKEDAKFKEIVELRNRADTLILTVEKTIKENESSLEGTEKEDMEKALEELKKAKESDDTKEIEDKIKSLSDASAKFAERIYSKAKAENSASSSNEADELRKAAENMNQENNSDNVEDAEVVD